MRNMQSDESCELLNARSHRSARPGDHTFWTYWSKRLVTAFVTSVAHFVFILRSVSRTRAFGRSEPGLKYLLRPE